ncbi:MAG: TonB-dependent receptor plug domain-containing protein [Colwellia sp.]|nr:TonB-dependent receptor plug domain-containing protein [Colwellia sp.]
MKNYLMYLFLLVMSILLLTLSVFAQKDTKLTEILAMDLDELMITVASKREEKASDASGILSVISAEDIRHFGGNDLHDVLMRVPNTFPFSSAVFTSNAISIRGGATTHTDSHTLISLNGRPVRTSFIGEINSTFFTSFPLNIIDRIEAIRGPGSILYGSNAFNGVMKTMTKTADNIDTNSVSVGYGLLRSRFGDITFSQYFLNGDATIVGAIKIMNSNGWELSALDSTGAVITPNDKWGLKLLYGEAFRSPYTLWSRSVHEAEHRVLNDSVC